MRGVSSTLSSGWVEDFQRATVALDASEAEKAQATAIFDGISSFNAFGALVLFPPVVVALFGVQGSLKFVDKFGIAYPNLPDPDGRLVLQFSDSLPPQAIPAGGAAGSAA